MSVLRPRPPEDPLAYDGGGWSPGPLADRLAAIRDRLVAAPGDVGLAPRTLEDYDTRRPESRLFAILTAARRIREAVDRLVILAGGSIGPATRLLAASGCHPFHDQLPRGERGGRPRLSWLDGRSGNDTLQGLFDMVAPPGGPRADDLLDRWAIMPVELPPAAPRQRQIEAILLARLSAALGDDSTRLAERVVPIAAGPGDGAAVAERLGCPLRFTAETGLDSAAGVFTAGGLLPAAVAGIDVVQLLKGAAAMLRRFAEAPLAENPPIIDGAIAFAAARSGRAAGRLFLGDDAWVSPLGAWHAAVRPTAPGAAALVTRLGSGEPRRDCIIEPPAAEPAVIGLPRVDEHAIGQLLQLLMLSAAVERQLLKAV
jgi:glucose-6-phosphate isomerase